VITAPLALAFAHRAHSSTDQVPRLEGGRCYNTTSLWATCCRTSVLLQEHSATTTTTGLQCCKSLVMLLVMDYSATAGTQRYYYRTTVLQELSYELQRYFRTTVLRDCSWLWKYESHCCRNTALLLQNYSAARLQEHSVVRLHSATTLQEHSATTTRLDCSWSWSYEPLRRLVAYNWSLLLSFAFTPSAYKSQALTAV
jgi:hypothetical protein